MPMITRRGLAAAALLPLAMPVLAQGAGLTRIAFGSCADQNQPQPIWRAVRAYQPEFFIFAGDNVYGGVRRHDLAELQEAYAGAMRHQEFMDFIASQPQHAAIWDDHDFGVNDGGVENPFKQQAKDAFLEFWHAPADDVRRRREGLYHHLTIGPAGQRVQIILLDTRWFRSALRITDQRGAPGRERYLPDDDPTKTMLGEAQWAWLRGCLEEPAELRLIVSSVQVLAVGHGWERWGNFPRERQRLFDLIASTKAGGVVFLSGDRHIGALYREGQGTPYALTEITSSGINRSFPNAREQGPNRLGELYARVNFGTLDIDWQQRRVALALRDEDGAVQRNVSLALDALRPA
jgi:alkaline phosphatase D